MADMYFADPSQSSEELGSKVMERVREFDEEFSGTLLYRNMIASYEAYYGRPDRLADSATVTTSGLQDEIQMRTVNHYRNVIQHVLVLIGGERPHFSLSSSTTDTASIEQTEAAQKVLEHFIHKERNANALLSALEYSIFMAKGFVRVYWDFQDGPLLAIEETRTSSESQEEETSQVPIYAGKLKLSAPFPLDVSYDMGARDGEWNWVAIRSYMNKWDLAAMFPEKRDAILMAGVGEYRYRKDFSDIFQMFINGTRRVSEDFVCVYDFYHRKTPSVPEGLQMRLLEGGEPLVPKTPLPIDWVPVFRMNPSKLMGTTEGYTPAFDALSIQQCIDSKYSIAMTNQAATGIPGLVVHRGGGWEYRGIANGVSIHEVDMNQPLPQPLKFVGTREEIFKSIDMDKRDMETIMGINSVVRGQPEAQFKSGVSLAAMNSLAVRFNSYLEAEYGRLLEDVGRTALHFARHHMSEEQLTEIMGESRSDKIDSFMADGAGDVDRVTVDLGNPATRTFSGRVETLQLLLQAGTEIDVNSIVELLKHGNLDAIIDDTHDVSMIIRSENEGLNRGEPQQALVTDNHLEHIPGHINDVLSSPDARENQKILSVTLEHLQQHLDLVQNAPLGLQVASGVDPNLLQLMSQLGGQTAQSAAQPTPNPAAVGEVGEMAEPSSLGDAALPALPEDPITGQQADLPEGGL